MLFCMTPKRLISARCLIARFRAMLFCMTPKPEQSHIVPALDVLELCCFV